MTPDMSQYGLGGPPSLSLMQLAVYGFLLLVLVLVLLTQMAVASLPVFFAALGVMEVGIAGLQNLPDPVGKLAKIAGLVFRGLRRNLLRTALTYVALFVLTGKLSLLYGIIHSIGKLTQDKEDSQLVIMTEKFGIPSMMPPGYVNQVKGLIERLPPEHRPADVDKSVMTWSFVGATLDPNKPTKDNSMFLFAIDPDVIVNGMMSEQGLTREDLGDEDWQKLLDVIEAVKQDKRNIVVGVEKLEALGLAVGDTIKLHGTNYKDIVFDCRIVGAFPAGSRMANNCAMRTDYLQSQIDDYRTRTGKSHPWGDRCTNLIWVRMPSKASYEQLAAVVNDPKSFATPVKMETFSAAIGSFLEPFKDILWGLKAIVMPAIVVIMCLVIGITITIGVRERWTEMAVLKVLGFQPWQVMGMIVSEAALIGVFGGMLSTWTVYWLPVIVRAVTHAFGTKVAFFEQFKSPTEILLYGPLLGLTVGIIGSALPSWNARKVKVSEVFAQVA